MDIAHKAKLRDTIEKWYQTCDVSDGSVFAEHYFPENLTDLMTNAAEAVFDASVAASIITEDNWEK